MTIFADIANNFNLQNVNNASKSIFEQSEIQNNIINDTILKRLYYTGKDAFNTRLQTNNAADTYTNKTIKIKRKKGQRTENVTLEDTGEFYNSFKLIASETFYSISANFEKGGANIYDNFTRRYANFNEFETAITTMSDDELQEFIDSVFLELFNNTLLNLILK